MIPCIIVPADLASPFRQAKENTARTGLSAIAMARQAALLILTVHGHELPGYAVNNDFYRQALDLDFVVKASTPVRFFRQWANWQRTLESVQSLASTL